jgi:SAM-dependent methyltransferase
MKLNYAAKLRCAVCASGPILLHPFELSGESRCRSGVLVCAGCDAWYPISDEIANTLPPAHAEAGSRLRFFEAHRPRMEQLGLKPPADSAPDPAFEAQADQRDHFDDLAVREDRFSYTALGRQPFQRAIRGLQFEEWGQLIRPGMLVLDIGCGDGLSTFDIASFDVEVIGLDVSGASIRRAGERAQREGRDNVTFMIGDADSLPLADWTIDCVLCYGSLHHVPSPERTLVEAARVLPSGGSYLGVENNTTPLRPVFDALMRLRPIWLEEAGAEAQIGSRELERWTAGTGLALDTRAIVFLPPQLCNLIGYRAARWLLRATDWVFGRIPVLRRWGGLISISGRRGPNGASSASTGPSDTSRRSTSNGSPSPEQPSLPATGS